MAKAIEHGIRSPKANSGSDKQEKAIAYGVRSVSDSFEKRSCEVNTPPSNAVFRAKGAKFDSSNPSFKKL
jgi:hypothetical protein